MRADFLATERHYLDHLAPIWSALDPDERGDFVVHPRAQAHAGRLGIDVVLGTRPRPDADVVVVASYADERRLGGIPAVLVEHGAGQHYGDHNPSYSGGSDHRCVVLFLCPSEQVAERWRSMYPLSWAEVVGTPKMDRWYGVDGDGGDCARSAEQSPVVAVSFHWDCRIFPESRNAWPIFGPHLYALTERFKVIGHGHPRVFGLLRSAYERMGIEPVADFADVLDRADVYACDNSSTIFEFASLDRPVVLLNAPWYRRNVDHGLRFWRHAGIGPQVADPSGLATAVDIALDDPYPFPSARRAMADEVYPLRDGRASVRAAAAIRNLLTSPAVLAPRRRNRMSTSNPYAPRSQARPRRLPPARSSEAVQSPPEELLARMRAVGAEDSQVEKFLDWHNTTDAEDREEAVAYLGSLTDDELAQMFADARDSRARESEEEGQQPSALIGEPVVLPGTLAYIASLGLLTVDSVGIIEYERLPEAAGSTVASIMAWVDHDPVRARWALSVEQWSDKPRVTLVEALEDVIAPVPSDG